MRKITRHLDNNNSGKYRLYRVSRGCVQDISSSIGPIFTKFSAIVYYGSVQNCLKVQGIWTILTPVNTGFTVLVEVVYKLSPVLLEVSSTNFQRLCIMVVSRTDKNYKAFGQY